jgi:predicted ATPase
VASALRERFPAIAEEQPELLAHHCEAAGAIDDAIQFLESAGRRATAASAYAESSRHLTRALGLLVTRPQTPARDVLELELQMGLGIALIATRGYASSELESVFMRAKELCERIAPGPRLFPVLRGRAAFHMARAEYAIARPLAEQCLEQAQQVGDSGFFLAGGSPLITTLFVLGDFAGVLALHERMSEIHDPAQHGALTFVFGEDPMLVARAFAALALQITGHSGRALELAEEGLRIARQRGHPIDIATALVYLAWLHQVRGEGPAAREYAREACDLARDQSLFFWGAFGLQVLGWSEGCCGEPEAGVALLRQGQALWSSGGIGTGRLAFLLWIAETELRAGRVEAARSAAEESLAHHRAHGEVHVLADLLRLHGDIALAGDVADPAAAQAHYERALEIARSQGARAFELRAATRLARLLAEQGRASAARALLQPIHAALVGSFQSADMEPARELLAQLA